MTLARTPIDAIPDGELLKRLARVADTERHLTAHLLALLGECDTRRLYLSEGCSSLFTYCVQVLHFSDHAAYHRIEAARAARQFPIILDMVTTGSLTLTTVALLRPHLTQDNHRHLLAAARHRTKREVEYQIACLAPKPAAKALIRRISGRTSVQAAVQAPAMPPADPLALPHERHAVPTPTEGSPSDWTSSPPPDSAPDTPATPLPTPTGRPAPGAILTSTPAQGAAAPLPPLPSSPLSPSSPSSPSSPLSPSSPPSPSSPLSPSSASSPPSPPPSASSASSPPPSTEPRPQIAPLAADRYLLRVTLSAETHAALRRAQQLLGPRVPSDDPHPVIARALSLLVENLERVKFARVRRPRSMPPGITVSPSAGGSRRVPAAIRREVWARDDGRCAFVGARGRCTETRQLEFHHVVPFARGGPTSVENLALRCRAHNVYESDLAFNGETAAGRVRPAGDASLDEGHRLVSWANATQRGTTGAAEGDGS